MRHLNLDVCFQKASSGSEQPGSGKLHKSEHLHFCALTRNECLLPFQLAFACVTGAAPSPHLFHCLRDMTTEIVTLHYTDNLPDFMPSPQRCPTPAAAEERLTLLLIDNDGRAPPRGTRLLCSRGPPPVLQRSVTQDFDPSSRTWEHHTQGKSAVGVCRGTQHIFRRGRCAGQRINGARDGSTRVLPLRCASLNDPGSPSKGYTRAQACLCHSATRSPRSRSFSAAANRNSPSN